MDMKTRLAKIVGPDFVKDGLAERYVYSMDMTENPPKQPAMVVMPSTVKEIQEIIEAANETLTPLIPFVTGQNVGGLTIPQVDGAVIVDLKRMDRIIEVDPVAMYMVIEPGVTFGHVRKYLDEHYPELVYTYPLAPPYTSVMANALLQGLCDFSTARGSMADFVNGLEAVLPTGELVKAGSGILGEGNWFGRYPLPDLVGLFSGWQGMTGIVTKIALQIFPRMPYSKHAALFTFEEAATTDLLIQIARSRVVDDVDCHSMSLVKMLMGIPYPVEVFEGEPDYGTLISISGNSLEEVNANYNVIEQIVENAKKDDPRQILVSWKAVKKLLGDEADSWLDFPSNAFSILTEFDGLSWVGTYINPKNWGIALQGGRKIVEKYGFELQSFLKPMNRMHFGEFKFIIRFPKDEDTLTRVRQCNEELLDFALDLGALPYKTPVWATNKLIERVDPGFLELMKKVKKTLDPNGIFNPGRWGL
ncbi:MAG: FAD-binding oxidoreductase [Candidatus Thorarchaeota archaeon]|nr:FAD-binding oxidoreductase [Candidatus Thorarchaeota archaeon]